LFFQDVFASLKREERKEKSVSCSKSISPRKGKKKTIQHRGGRFVLLRRSSKKKQKRNISLSLSLSFVQILSFAIKQTRKLSESIDRAKSEVFLSRPFARITKRRRKRERESHPVLGAINSLFLSLSLFLSFFFLFPKRKKTR